MPNFFRKVKQIYLTSFQEAIAYRQSTYFWIVAYSLPFLMMYFVWSNVFSSNQTLAGFSFNQMVTYYFASFLAFNFAAPSGVEWSINWRIREGTFSEFLSKPYNFFLHYLVSPLAYLTLRFLLTFPIAVIFYFLFNNLISKVPFSNIVLFILALCLGYLINLCFSFFLSFIAFWHEDAEGFFHLKQTVTLFLSGGLLPLEFFGSYSYFLKLLPFSYIISFPVNLYLGKLSAEEIAFRFLVGFSWLIILGFSAKIFYKLSVNKYSAVGG